MERKQVLLPVDGCELHLTVCGNEGAPVLVLLHGGPGSGAAPLMALPAFQELERRFTTVYFDQRGSGDSYWDLADGLSEEQLTGDVQAVVLWAKEQFPGGPVYLWGGSFGGLLGLLYLRRYPDTVERAVVSSPAVFPEGTLGGRESLRQAMRGLAAAVPEKYSSMLLSAEELWQLEENPLMEELLHGLKRLPEGAEGGFCVYAMRKWFLSCDARPVLSGVRIPLRLMQGMEDPICPAALLVEAYEACGNPLVSLKTYSPCGHAVFEDRRDEFTEELTTFFTQE